MSEGPPVYYKCVCSLADQPESVKCFFFHDALFLLIILYAWFGRQHVNQIAAVYDLTSS